MQTPARCSSDCEPAERDLIGDELETHGIVPSIGRAEMVEPKTLRALTKTDRAPEILR